MEIISEEECVQVVSNWAKSVADSDHQTKLLSYKVIPFDNVEKKGHLGEYYQLQVRVSHGCGEKSLVFFLKRPLSAANRADFIKLVTHKEVEFCKFLSDCKSKGPVNDTFAPQYYYLSDTIIVMEDLSTRYRLCEEPHLDPKHLGVALKCLAKLHAFTLNKRDELNYCGFLKEGMFSIDGNYSGSKYMNCLIEGICVYMEEIGRTTEYLNSFRKEAKRMLENFDKPQDDSPMVICHGDLWINNILFAYDENDEPIDCKLIDFQLTRLAPPAHDVTTLIVHNTSEYVKHELLISYYDEYYEYLKKELADLDVNIKCLLPKEQFLDTCYKYLRIAKVTKVLYAAFSAAIAKRSAGKVRKPLDVAMQENQYNFVVEMCCKDPDMQKMFQDNMRNLDNMLMGNDWITREQVQELLENIFKIKFDVKYYAVKRGMILTITVHKKSEILNLTFTVKAPSAKEFDFFMQEGLFSGWHKLQCLQKCFLACPDALFLEHLGDFSLVSCRKPFTLDEVKMCLDSLAEFHAQGYVDNLILKDCPYRVSRRDEFQRIYPRLKWLFECYNLKISQEKLRGLFLSVDELDDTLLHGAFHNFNVLLNEYSENCKIVNFSHMKIGNPAEEVLSFLYYSTTGPFRLYNMEEMLIYYYDELASLLKRKKLLPFTLEEFLNCCESFKTTAVLKALIFHQCALLAEKRELSYEFVEENWPDKSIIQENYESDIVYKEKLDELVREFVQIYP